MDTESYFKSSNSGGFVRGPSFPFGWSEGMGNCAPQKTNTGE